MRHDGNKENHFAHYPRAIVKIMSSIKPKMLHLLFSFLFVLTGEIGELP